MSLTRYVGALRERKVLPWALAYLAGAFAVLQGIDFLSDTFEWPRVITRVATVVLSIGLLAALVLAWYHGSRGPQRVQRTEAVLLGGIAVVALAAGVYTARGSSTRAAGEVADGSIAVLPFVDLSRDRDQEYFADGITEEILNTLAGVPDLRVAARTSAFAFKGKSVPVDEIAERLRVKHVLEGSVRKEGEQLRITAKLVDADRGYQLWSQSFDRQLANVFAIQEEIARAIASALEVRLVHSQHHTESTARAHAHELFLRGREYLHRRGAQNLRTALHYFEQSIATDSAYAPGWAGVALTQVVLPFYDPNAPYEHAFARTEAPALRALRLEPNLAEAHLARAYARFRWSSLVTEAEPMFQRALLLRPNDVPVLRWYGEYLSYTGRAVEGERMLRRAVALDPLSAVARTELASALYYGRKYEQAIAAANDALAIDPRLEVARAWRLAAYMVLDRWAEAARELPLLHNTLRLDSTAVATIAAGLADPAAKPAALREWRRQRPAVLEQLQLLPVALELGDTTTAFDMLERLVQTTSNTSLIEAIPDVDPLRNHPRFREILRKAHQ